MSKKNEIIKKVDTHLIRTGQNFDIADFILGKDLVSKEQKVQVQIDSSWQPFLNEEFSKPYFQKMVSFLKKEYELYDIHPKANDIFKAFNLCSFDKVKVVILNAESHNILPPNGLCFSDNGRPFNKNLSNIYKEISDDLGIDISGRNGDLSNWAEQGILLINEILTQRSHTPGAHKNIGWEKFTDRIFEILNEHKTNIVFLLWGSRAHKKSELINSSNNLVLKASHPSPLSAYRGFFGSKHFTKTNDYLTENGIEPIIW